MVAKALAVVAGLVLGVWAMTQVFAYQACVSGGWGFPAALGAPLYHQGVLAFYRPWAIVQWWVLWGRVVPNAFLLPGVFGLVVCGMTLYRAFPRATHKEREAHWATRRELQEAECLPRWQFVWHGWDLRLRKIGLSGVILGWCGWVLLKYYGDGHIVIDAGSGTGKTTMLKSTLLDDEPGQTPSLILHDPKGVLYQDTAGYRATVSRVLCVEPLSERTAQWNPWDFVRVGTPDEGRDIDVITDYLINPNKGDRKDETSKHFQDLLRRVFRGISLFGLLTGAATTGAEFNELVNRPGPDEASSSWDMLMSAMKQCDHPLVQMAAEVATRPGDRELGSLQTTIANALDIFSDARVAHFTSASTFTMQALREQEEPCTVYYIVPFADQHRLMPLTRLFLGQCFDHCISRVGGWQHRVRVILEEFPSLGYFPAIVDGLNTWREFGMQLVLVTPSMASLINTYGVHHNFKSCRVHLAFGLDDDTSAESVSKRIGTHTVSQRRVSTTQGRKTISVDEREEPLITTTGVLKLHRRSVLVKAGPSAVIARQARFYERRRWFDRSRVRLVSEKGEG